MSQNEIIYPIFVKCCEYASNNFWKVIFEELSQNKLPKGVYIQNRTMKSNRKGQEFTYKIPTSNPEQIYNDISSLFKNILNIRSNNEKITKHLQLQEKCSNLYDEWSNIKKKSIKDFLIQNYVIDMKKKYNLTNTQATKLNANIYTGLLYKLYENEDFNYIKGKIISIKGIEFNDNKIIINKNLGRIEPVKIIDSHKKSRTLLDIWEKMLINS